MTTTTKTAYAYIRLSRDDLRQPGTEEEKFTLRAQTAKRIAEQYELSLPDANILTERQSGGTLAGRPVMRSLLALIKTGAVKHLISPYIDRVLRGDKADEQEIEDTFVRAGVTVYTSDNAPISFNADYDPLLFEVRALVARTELRGTIKKRRDADMGRLRAGVRSRSYAPYGYRLLAEVRDEYRNLLSPARYEIIPEEWHVLCSIRDRILTDSIGAIVRDLNKASVPTSSLSRRSSYIASKWTENVVKQIVLNPFYCGHYAHTSRIVRGRRVKLPESEWILSSEGDWQALWTLDDRQSALDAIAGRKNKGTAHNPNISPGLLTGLLFNWCGFPMSKKSRDTYQCTCKRNRARHPMESVYIPKIERFVLSAVADALETVDIKRLQSLAGRAAKRKGGVGGSADSGEREHRAKRTAQVKAVAECRNKVQEMIIRRSDFIALFGEREYETAAIRARDELTAAERRLSEMPARSREHGESGEYLSAIMGAITALKAGKGTIHGQLTSPEATYTELRAVMDACIDRIDILPPVSDDARTIGGVQVGLRQYLIDAGAKTG